MSKPKHVTTYAPSLHYAIERAVKASKSKKPTSAPGYCLRETREALGVGAKYLDAIGAWQQANHHHRIQVVTDKALAGIPDGAPIFWSGGSEGHGHVALAAPSLGAGLCMSMDIERPGFWDAAPIRLIGRRWGLRFLGWTEDLNGVRLIQPEVK